MTGEIVCDLIRPLIGKSGSIYLMMSRIGPVGLAATETNKLTSVELRPDGMVSIERENGWTVLDPGEVVVIGWNGDPEHSPGQFL